MGDVLRRVAAVTCMDTNDRNVHILRYDSPELEMAREEFTRQWRQGRFTVKTFQEAKGLKGLQGLNEKVFKPMFLRREQEEMLKVVRLFRTSLLHWTIRVNGRNI